MILKDIIAISGEPGLFKFIAQGKNAIIVEHLETGKRSSVFSSAKVSSLEDISVFTENEDMPLGKIFDRIFEKESGGLTMDSRNDSLKLKEYFNEVIPEYSKEKVYVSDIKKILLWYNLLHNKNMLVREEPDNDLVNENTEPETAKNQVVGEKVKKGNQGTKKGSESAE